MGMGTDGDTPAELALRRRWYLEELEVAGGWSSADLTHAFARVPREDFLPPGPWTIEALGGDYYPTPDASIRHILHAVGICLDIKRNLNSGNPALVGRSLALADVRPGETVFHVGSGFGYFTAVLAELAGPKGRVIAAEIDPDLRAAAARNLSRYPHVTVVGDALTEDLPPVDVVFSSAGLATVPRRWVDALRPGGRMLLPLTGSLDGGYVFRFRRTADPSRFDADRITVTRYFPCAGTRDPADMSALDLALCDRRIDLASRLSLRLDPHDKDELCWLHAADYCLRLE